MSKTKTTISLVCLGCAAVNRVPLSRITEEPICGKCKQALVPDYPVELTDANFQKFISRTSIPIVIDFWAAWCGPCRMMAPAFAAAAKELSPLVILAKLNTEEANQTAAGFNISGIPCLIAFRNGQEVARQSGAMSTEQIVKWVKAV